MKDLSVATMAYLHEFKDIFKSALWIVLLFFFPVRFLILSVVVATSIDTFYGIKSSRKDGQRYSSKKFRTGFFPKLVKYSVAVLVTYLFDYSFVNEFVKMVLPYDFLATKVIAAAVVWNEVISVDESWIKIYGYSFIDKLKEFIKKVVFAKKTLKDNE